MIKEKDGDIMAKSANQKRKILLLERILAETDESHPIGMREIIEKLAGADVQAERKSIYGDLEELRNVGMKISFRKGKPSGYYLEQSTQYGTLIPQGEGACTLEMNETTEEESLVENVGKNEEETTQESKTKNIDQSTVAENWEKVNGEYIEVQLRCKNSAVSGLILRYGENCRIIKEEEKHKIVAVPEICGNAFYGWLTAQAGAVRIMKPKEAVKEYRKLLKKIMEGYKKQ